MTRQFTAIIEREDGGYVALCPELDIASQGSTIEEARANLLEALELFWRPPLPRRSKSACAVGTITVPVPDHDELRTGTLRAIIGQSGIDRSEFET